MYVCVIRLRGDDVMEAKAPQPLLSMIYISSPILLYITLSSLAPGRCGSNLKCVIFKLIIKIDTLNTSHEITQKWS